MRHKAAFDDTVYITQLQFCLEVSIYSFCLLLFVLYTVALATAGDRIVDPMRSHTVQWQSVNTSGLIWIFNEQCSDYQQMGSVSPPWFYNLSWITNNNYCAYRWVKKSSEEFCYIVNTLAKWLSACNSNPIEQSPLFLFLDINHI